MNSETLIKNTGLLLIIGIYAVSLFSKLSDYEDLKSTVIKKNMPFPSIAAPSAIIMLLFGVVSIALFKLGKLDRKYAVYGIDSLIIFTSLATYYFHNMFTNPKQKYYFEKNIAIIGGLMYIRQTL